MSFDSEFMKKGSIFKPAVVILAILLVIGGVYSFLGDEKEVSQGAFTGKVRDARDVEQIIAKWIEENPEAILNSVANMQKKAMEEQAKSARKTISEKQAEIFADDAPSYAPSGYTATVVEFYDYNCGYCKRANASLEQLLQKDKKVRVIYRDFPILGPSSQELSKVSIAVSMVSPKAFRTFHNNLMKSRSSNKAQALKIAAQSGVNVAGVRLVLKKKDAEIMQIIEKNRQLGSGIGIQGTPAFVIGEELIPGAVDAATLQAKINALR